MQELPLISVVVPVYNVEDYLETCIASILGQTYPNLELLLVDDASTDASGLLCDACAMEESRVRVVHLSENCGVSHARNEGIRLATGRFVTFVDPDDYIDSTMLAHLYTDLIEYSAEISVCAVERTGFGKYAADRNGDTACCLSNGEALVCMAQGTPFGWSIGGKLYVLDAVRCCPFEESIHCGEDILFLYRLLPSIKVVSYRPDRLYHYVHREGSTTQSGFSPRLCTELTVYETLWKDAATERPELVSVFAEKILMVSVRLAVKAVEGGEVRGRQLLSYLRKFHKSIRRCFSRNALVNIPYRKIAVEVVLLYLSAELFWGVTVLYKRLKEVLP